MLDKWHKKEKPVFTGIARGVGGFSFGAAGDTGPTIDEDGTQSKPFTTIANAYLVGASNGLHYFQNAGVNSGTAFQLRFASYDNRGWVETFYSLDTTKTTPWDHFLSYGGANRPTLTNFNLSNGGLDYTSISGAVVLLGTGFNIVDVAITSKSSKTGNGVAATGANQESALPLIASDDLAGTEAAQARQRLADFFEGSATGFSIGGQTSGVVNEDYAAYWSKSGATPTGPFELHLGYREGVKSTTEFHLVDGNTSPGATYSPNIGWRDDGTHGGSKVGSWSTGTAEKDAAYNIDSENVLSVWLSDSLT